MPILPVDGAVLYWEGAGAGAPLLLVPGTACAIPVWGDLVGELAANRRVIAYERRGFNRSAGPPARHQRVHANDAADLLRHAEAVPAAVLGWSGGGLTALALAVEHPAMVSSLILVEPSLHMIRNLGPGLLAANARAAVKRLLAHDDPGAVDVMYRWVMSYTDGGTAYDRFPASWREQIRNSGVAIRAESAQETARYPARHRIAALTCPITCVVGARSVFTKPSRYLAKTNPRVRVVEVEGACHAIHFDRPQALAGVVRLALRDEQEADDDA